MSYTAVTVDGLPAVFYYWPNTTSNHWRGEQLLASQGLQNISTTAIRIGEIGYGVDSYMERGGETFKGKLKYQANTFGAQNFDINVSGKLAKKTYFTLSASQNFDPGAILADEPTGSLDPEMTDEVIDLLRQAAHQLGKCVIVVTHSKRVADSADAVYTLRHKKLAKA